MSEMWGKILWTGVERAVHQYCNECGSELDVYEETDYNWGVSLLSTMRNMR